MTAWIGGEGTQVQVRYHGRHTPMLQVQSGCAQGSTLSPLLWALVAWLQQLQRQGRIDRALHAAW